MARDFNVVIRVVGESDQVQLQTRWKERNGQPTIVEVSHVSRTVIAELGGEGDAVIDVEEGS